MAKQVTASSVLTTSELLAKARRQAVRTVPYLARGFWAMTFIESDKAPTLGVDAHWRVYCNPAYVRKCADEDTLVGEIIHECLHPTLRHASRAKIIHAEDHRHWNCCGDAELDQRIEEIGSVKLVATRVRPKDLGGEEKMTAEELYRLPRKPKPKGPRCAGGSGTGGEKQPWEKGDDASGLTEVQAEIVRAGVAAAIKDYVEQKGRGSVPDGIARWAEEFGDAPPVDWRMLAQAKVRYAIDSHRGAAPSYARPARRDGGGGLILPVHRLPIPKVRLVCDTSGSMREGDISVELACVFDACESLGQVSVVACDAEAHDPVEVRHVDDLREFLLGGGGTDMPAGIAAAAESSPTPDAIVVVTDGETNWPETEPEIPVIIVLTRESHYSHHTPEWAEIVHAF